MKLWIDLDKWPKPERSGMIGVILAFSFLWWMLTPASNGSGGLLDALVCEIAPWKCSGSDGEQSERNQKRPAEVHMIVFAPNLGSHAKSRPIPVCHYDFRKKVTGEISHFLAAPYNSFWVSNDTGEWHELKGMVMMEYRDPPGEWWTFGGESKSFMDADAYRFHCTEQKNLCTPRPNHYFDDCVVTGPK